MEREYAENKNKFHIILKLKKILCSKSALTLMYSHFTTRPKSMAIIIKKKRKLTLMQLESLAILK